MEGRSLQRALAFRLENTAQNDLAREMMRQASGAGILDPDALHGPVAWMTRDARRGWHEALVATGRLGATCSALHALVQPMVVLHVKLAFRSGAEIGPQLDLRDNKLMHLPPLSPSEFGTLSRMLAVSCSLRHLTTLRISGRARQPQHFCSVAAFAGRLSARSLPQLSTLDLNGAQMGADGAHALADALTRDAVSSLTSLDLTYNALSPAPFRGLTRALAGGALPRLRSLLLALNAQLGCEGACYLAEALAAGATPVLSNLNLEDSGVGLVGCRAIAAAMLAGGASELGCVSIAGSRVMQEATQAAIDAAVDDAAAADAAPSATPSPGANHGQDHGGGCGSLPFDGCGQRLCGPMEGVTVSCIHASYSGGAHSPWRPREGSMHRRMRLRELPLGPCEWVWHVAGQRAREIRIRE